MGRKKKKKKKLNPSFYGHYLWGVARGHQINFGPKKASEQSLKECRKIARIIHLC
jgi:hypothetical protein